MSCGFRASLEVLTRKYGYPYLALETIVSGSNAKNNSLPEVLQWIEKGVNRSRYMCIRRFLNSLSYSFDCLSESCRSCFRLNTKTKKDSNTWWIQIPDEVDTWGQHRKPFSTMMRHLFRFVQYLVHGGQSIDRLVDLVMSYWTVQSIYGRAKLRDPQLVL